MGWGRHHKWFPDMDRTYDETKYAFCQLASCRAKCLVRYPWIWYGPLRFHTQACLDEFLRVNKLDRTYKPLNKGGENGRNTM